MPLYSSVICKLSEDGVKDSVIHVILIDKDDEQNANSRGRFPYSRVSPRKYPAMELGGGGEVGCSGEYLSSGYFESFACQF